MVETQTDILGLILEKLDQLTVGQKELEKKFEYLAADTASSSGSPAFPPRLHRGSTNSSGIETLMEGGTPLTPTTEQGLKNLSGLPSSPIPSATTFNDPISPRTLSVLAKNAPRVPVPPSGDPEANRNGDGHVNGNGHSHGNGHALGQDLPPKSTDSGVDVTILEGASVEGGGPGKIDQSKLKDKELYPKRVILTTYPGQPGIHPFPLHWGAGPTARDRGPVICSRMPSSLPLRNAIGAMGGSYSIYRSMSIAMRLLPSDFRPDFTNTSPPFEISPCDGWFTDKATGKSKIVSMDPWGAVAQTVYEKEYQQGLDIRPTISQTMAHIKIQELDELYKQGLLLPDGNIVIKSPDLPAFPGVDQGIEVNCYKAAIDPVWYLPGVADRLGVPEALLRRALFEESGGSHAELLTRPDLKTYLPPIGGQTVYIFGDPSKLRDPNVELTFRPHDECNGSDVFGSDICTCRPYLIFGIQEAVKCAQRGGVGCVIYFRKEGRALGEVTKYLVYNIRKRGGDSAERYFKSTELVAGVKDQRFQDLSMPDTLQWLGIKKIDNLISMSDMKYNAITGPGECTVINRYEIPAELMPPDSQVEIQAKIAAGYFSKSKVAESDLHLTKGRTWEDVVH